MLAEVQDAVAWRTSDDADLDAEQAIIAGSVERMARRLDPAGAHDVLRANLDHPRWDDVRTLPVLYELHAGVPDLLLHCGGGRDRSLTGDVAERHQRWDSCFTLDHSYIHGAGASARHPLPLPAVADPQARRRGSISSASPAASAADAASPGARPASTSPRRWRRSGGRSSHDDQDHP